MKRKRVHSAPAADSDVPLPKRRKLCGRSLESLLSLFPADDIALGESLVSKSLVRTCLELPSRICTEFRLGSSLIQVSISLSDGVVVEMSCTCCQLPPPSSSHGMICCPHQIATLILLRRRDLRQAEATSIIPETPATAVGGGGGGGFFGGGGVVGRNHQQNGIADIVSSVPEYRSLLEKMDPVEVKASLLRLVDVSVMASDGTDDTDADSVSSVDRLFSDLGFLGHHLTLCREMRGGGGGGLTTTTTSARRSSSSSTVTESSSSVPSLSLSDALDVLPVSPLGQKKVHAFHGLRNHAVRLDRFESEMDRLVKAILSGGGGGSDSSSPPSLVPLDTFCRSIVFPFVQRFAGAGQVVSAVDLMTLLGRRLFEDLGECESKVRFPRNSKKAKEEMKAMRLALVHEFDVVMGRLLQSGDGNLVDRLGPYVDDVLTGWCGDSAEQEQEEEDSPFLVSFLTVRNRGVIEEVLRGQRDTIQESVAIAHHRLTAWLSSESRAREEALLSAVRYCRALGNVPHVLCIGILALKGVSGSGEMLDVLRGAVPFLQTRPLWAAAVVLSLFVIQMRAAKLLDLGGGEEQEEEEEEGELATGFEMLQDAVQDMKLAAPKVLLDELVPCLRRRRSPPNVVLEESAMTCLREAAGLLFKVVLETRASNCLLGEIVLFFMKFTLQASEPGLGVVQKIFGWYSSPSGFPSTTGGTRTPSSPSRDTCLLNHDILIRRLVDLKLGPPKFVAKLLVRRIAMLVQNDLGKRGDAINAMHAEAISSIANTLLGMPPDECHLVFVEIWASLAQWRSQILPAVALERYPVPARAKSYFSSFRSEVIQALLGIVERFTNPQTRCLLCEFVFFWLSQSTQRSGPTAQLPAFADLLMRTVKLLLGFVRTLPAARRGSIWGLLERSPMIRLHSSVMVEILSFGRESGGAPTTTNRFQTTLLQTLEKRVPEARVPSHEALRELLHSIDVLIGLHRGDEFVDKRRQLLRLRIMFDPTIEQLNVLKTEYGITDNKRLGAIIIEMLRKEQGLMPNFSLALTIDQVMQRVSFLMRCHYHVAGSIAVQAYCSRPTFLKRVISVWKSLRLPDAFVDQWYSAGVLRSLDCRVTLNTRTVRYPPIMKAFVEDLIANEFRLLARKLAHAAIVTVTPRIDARNYSACLAALEWCKQVYERCGATRAEFSAVASAFLQRVGTSWAQWRSQCRTSIQSKISTYRSQVPQVIVIS